MSVWGIEANPKYYKRALQKYSDTSNISFHLFNFAAGQFDGTINLYRHWNDLGNSIYRDKRGVTPLSINVPLYDFAPWIQKTFGEKKPGDITILKANIEGAEWDVLQSLKSANMLEFFDVYLGSLPGKFSDISKVQSLVAKDAPNKTVQLLSEHGIKVKKFCHGNAVHPNVSITEEIENIIHKQQSPAHASSR